MSLPDITKLDLNLLKVLNAVYQCGSTVKAAEQLGVSQSRVSQMLGTLRDELNDPLFIRAQGRLQPTARATALSQCLTRVLPEIYAHCYDPASFNPEHYNGRINIYVSAILIDALGPKVLSRLARLLPKARVFLKQWSPLTIEEINQDELNIGINHFPLSIGKNVRQIPVAREQGVVTMRRGHPMARADLTVQELFSGRMAGAIIPEMTETYAIVEAVLKDVEIDFAVRSDNLPALFEAVRESDLVMVGLTVPNSLRPSGMICFSPACLGEIPMNDLSIAIYYRQSLAQDPRIVFLEDHLREVIQECTRRAIDSLDQPRQNS